MTFQTSETLFQRALQRQSLATPPVWMMRQAGRYHKHYQALRKNNSFMDLCKKPDLATEVAMGPIRDFDFDAAILFSDLLFPLEVLGMPLTYEPAPTLGWHLESDSQLLGFKSTDEALKGLTFQAEALQKTRAALPKEKSLIGFVGGPWTLFVYAVEGSHKGGLQKSIGAVSLYKKFAELMVPLLKKNISLQLNAGAEVVMIFDTASGDVTPEFYAEHLLPDLKNLFGEKIGYYMKGGSVQHYAAVEDGLCCSPIAGFGFDHHFNIAERIKHSKKGFVQGNFNQAHLTLEPSEFKKEFDKWVAPIAALSAAERAGWVAGLGHGVTPQAKEENVRTFVQEIRKVFK